jgi:hypothetical protein
VANEVIVANVLIGAGQAETFCRAQPPLCPPKMNRAAAGNGTVDPCGLARPGRP